VPKNLTDVSQWETVEVPVGTDPATAGSVETPFQTLADRTRYLLNNVATLIALQLLNWIETDASALHTAITGGLGVACHDESVRVSLLETSTSGGDLAEEVFGLGGLVWGEGAAPAEGEREPCVACDGQGVFALVPGLMACPTGTIQFRDFNGAATWVVWTAGTPASTSGWILIEHDWIGRWVIADLDGVMKKCNGAGAAFTALSTPPAWGGAAPLVLKHSHDPLNPIWIALTGGFVSHSADGNVWSAAVAHDWSAAPSPGQVAYSARSQAWIGVDANGTLYRSSDDGQTWSEISTGSPAAMSTIIEFSTLNQALISSDGLGGWVVVYTADTAQTEVFVSADDGETWSQVELPALAEEEYSNLWYGGGRFHLLTNDGGGNWKSFTTLRLDRS
jgi:hypothetical protein